MTDLALLPILGLLVAIGLIIFAVDLIVRYISHRMAVRIVRQIHESAEKAEPDIPYSPPAKKRRAPKKRLRRIAMVAPAGLYEKATVKSRMLSMGISLTERGHQVTIFVPPWDCPNRSYLSKALDPLQVVHIRPAKWMPRLYDPFLFARLLRQVIRFQPEVIYSFKPVGYSGAVLFAAYFLRRLPWIGSRLSFKQLLVDTDNWEGLGGWADRIETAYPLKLIRDRQERWSLRHADAVTAASKELKYRTESLREGTDSVFYVPNGLRVQLWPRTPPGQPILPDLDSKLEQLGRPGVLLLFTKFAEFKTEVLIAIFAEILKSVPNTVLVVVGTSFDRVSRRERLKLLPLADDAGIERERIIPVGWVPSYADLRKYWSVASVALYPADDTFVNRVKSPIKLLELMAAGKPIVAHKVGEIGEIIKNGKNGLLVPPGDIHAFTTAVVKLLQDPDLRTSLGRAANDTVHTRFAWSKIVKQVERAIIVSARN